MVIVRTWLLVAAERREFDGIRNRMGNAKQIVWHGAKFAWEAEWQGDRWWMLANGPGEALVLDALQEKKDVDGMISTGLCGALDPALRLGDVVVSGNVHIDTRAAFVRGAVHTIDHVAAAAAEKRTLRDQTGAIAVDMESAAIEKKAAECSDESCTDERSHPGARRSSAGSGISRRRWRRRPAQTSSPARS